jgi:DNA-binding winged helix-turn-helix (wHTH) protein
MNGNNIRYYEFGEFRLDIRKRILLQNGNRIPLTAKVFELLHLMVQNEGQVLEHDELLDKVWEGMFVEQSNLKKNISTLRHILGEKPNESFYIKTVPRRGYSFVAEVRAVAEDGETAIYREIETEVIFEEEVKADLPVENTKYLESGRPQGFFR